MFSDLPNLLDRNFAVAYALPFAIFLAISLFLCREFNVYELPSSATKVDLATGAVGVTFASWAGGIILSGLNHTILQFLEGYGKYNPFQLIKFRQKNSYHKLLDEIKETKQRAREKGEGSKAHDELAKLMIKQNQLYPDDEAWLLPTSFGNAIRAFEIYPRVMYGMESIDGWSRLLTVIPEGYKDTIDSAKAIVDMWVNFCILSVLIVAEYWLFAFYNLKYPYLWIPLVAVIWGYIAYNRTRDAIIWWGDTVKASFDVFLPELAEKMGYELPTDHQEMYDFWQSFSIAIIYRRRKSLIQLKRKSSTEEQKQTPLQENPSEQSNSQGLEINIQKQVTILSLWNDFLKLLGFNKR